MDPDLTLHLIGPGDAAPLDDADVFDGPVDPIWFAGFLAEPSHLIVAALHVGRAVGFVSGAVLHHPDKPPGLFIIKLGVNQEFRRRGIATALLAAIREAAATRGAVSGWVLTENDNSAARALCSGLGTTGTADVVMFEWDAPDAGPDGSEP